MRNAQQYIESLRDGREVYIHGERVEDITQHPSLRKAIDHGALDYELDKRPELRDLLVTKSPRTGNEIIKNFTDIDDKIIDRANKEGVSITEISEHYIKLHNGDMTALGVVTPTVTPKATEHMEDMITLIGVLEKERICLLCGWRCIFCDK